MMWLRKEKGGTKQVREIPVKLVKSIGKAASLVELRNGKIRVVNAAKLIPDAQDKLQLLKQKVLKKAEEGKEMRNRIKDLLAEFGVENASRLREDQYAPFIQKLNAL